jgi:hypothetical protein
MKKLFLILAITAFVGTYAVDSYAQDGKKGVKTEKKSEKKSEKKKCCKKGKTCDKKKK